MERALSRKEIFLIWLLAMVVGNLFAFYCVVGQYDVNYYAFTQAQTGQGQYILLPQGGMRDVLANRYTLPFIYLNDLK